MPVLNVAGLKIADMFLRTNDCFSLIKYDKNYFDWYVESLAAVPPNSRLRAFALELHVQVPLEARNLGSQGVWGILDEVLSSENLQLDTLTIHVLLKPSPNGARTPALVQKLQAWLTEICFPKVVEDKIRLKQLYIELARQVRDRQLTLLRCSRDPNCIFRTLLLAALICGMLFKPGLTCGA